LLGLLSKNFSWEIGEISLVDISLIFSITFLVEKELSCWIGFLVKITGLWSIKIGFGTSGVSGKFSVVGGSLNGSLFSNHFLPARMGPTSPSGS